MEFLLVLVWAALFLGRDSYVRGLPDQLRRVVLFLSPTVSMLEYGLGFYENRVQTFTLQGYQPWISSIDMIGWLLLAIVLYVIDMRRFRY